VWFEGIDEEGEEKVLGDCRGGEIPTFAVDSMGWASCAGLE